MARIISPADRAMIRSSTPAGKTTFRSIYPTAPKPTTARPAKVTTSSPTSKTSLAEMATTQSPATPPPTSFLAAAATTRSPLATATTNSSAAAARIVCSARVASISSRWPTACETTLTPRLLTAAPPPLPLSSREMCRSTSAFPAKKRFSRLCPVADLSGAANVTQGTPVQNSRGGLLGCSSGHQSSRAPIGRLCVFQLGFSCQISS